MKMSFKNVQLLGSIEKDSSKKSCECVRRESDEEFRILEFFMKNFKEINEKLTFFSLFFIQFLFFVLRKILDS